MIFLLKENVLKDWVKLTWEYFRLLLSVNMKFTRQASQTSTLIFFRLWIQVLAVCVNGRVILISSFSIFFTFFLTQE